MSHERSARPGVQKVLVLVSDAPSFEAARLLRSQGHEVHLAHFGHMASLPVDSLEALGHDSDVHLLPVCTGFVAKDIALQAAAALAHQLELDAIATGDLEPQEELELGLPWLRPLEGGSLDLAALEATFPDDPEHIFSASTETVSSVLAMHRVVSL